MRNFFVIIILFISFFSLSHKANAQCQPLFTSSTNASNNLLVTFTDSSLVPSGSTLSWQWDFGDNDFSAVQNPSHNYQSSGTYLVCLTITVTSGNQILCTAVYCDSVVVGNGGSGNNGGSSGCIDSLLIDSSMVCLQTYDPVCGCDSVTYHNSCYATYYGGVTSYNYGPCSMNGGNCQASFTGAPSLVDSLKYYFTNTSSSLSNSQPVLGLITTWVWNFGDGDTSLLMNPTHKYTQAGAYEVCLAITQYQGNSVSCTDTFCDSVFVGMGLNSNPSNNFPPCYAYFWEYQDSLNPNLVYLLDLSLGGTTTSYTWDFGDGNSSTQANPTHTYAQYGTYNICLTIMAMDSNNFVTCTAMYCDSVSVDTNQLRSNGFSIQVVNESVLSNISRVIGSTNNIKIYPNPVLDELNIDISSGSNYKSLCLFDASGRLCKSMLLSIGQNKIKTKELSKGIYIIQLISEEGIEHVRVIKE